MALKRGLLFTGRQVFYLVGCELPGAPTRMEFNIFLARNFFLFMCYVIIYFMFHSIVIKKIRKCGFVNHAEIRYFYIFLIAGD